MPNLLPTACVIPARQAPCLKTGGVPCHATTSTTKPPFEPLSKRRRGYPSEAQVKIGLRMVHGDKLLEEKLGRNDLCPCGSRRRFKKCCLKKGCF
ncbi:MAG: SEC-C domain-containing protein [Planctomycetes bacterium]|nr:SEC-C domain-containing protein [Planctomycetota bacterium]